MSLNRSIAPKIVLPNSINFPTAEKEVLENNLPLYIVSGTTEPVIRIILFFEAGKYFELKKHVSIITNGMLDKGTLTKNAYQIAESLDFYGASLRFESNLYLSSFTLSCLKSQLPYILPILNDILVNAQFPEDELEKLKSRIKQKLKINLKKSEYIATQNFNAALFGENHPFGYSLDFEDVEKIEQEDLSKHFKAHYGVNDFTFGVVAGDVGEQEMKLLQLYLGNIPQKQSFTKNHISNPSDKFLIETEKEKSVQSALRVGFTSIGRDHPDYEAFKVVNTILGGYFGSRLMSNIREDKGYTYGIYSHIIPVKDLSIFVISTEVGKEYKEKTLQEISNEIERLKNDPIGDEELLMVKNYLTGMLMKDMDGPLKTANTLKKLLSFGQNQWTVNEIHQTIQGIDSKRIMELANKYLNFDKMYKVIAS